MTVTGDARVRTIRIPVLERVAGAPISWGVCEVPGWGWQYDPATVLTQMREVGLRATEFGPEGFLPEAPEAKAALLARTGCAPSAGSSRSYCTTPTTTRCPRSTWPWTVSSPRTPPRRARGVTGSEGYDDRPVLDDEGWATLLGNLDRLDGPPPRAASWRPCTPTSAPWSSPVRRPSECSRGRGIGLCLDTGHLLVGGGDPVAVAAAYPDRVVHVHLKDVAADVAARVRQERLSYTDGVRAGMYRPLGAGDVDVAAIVTSLENAGYAGWYVLEQDTILDAEPTEGGATRPPVEDVRVSLDHLRDVAARLDPRD